MTDVTLARHAMNTRFELVLHGPDPVALRAAGEAALNEVERVENQLSLFRPTSEIAHVNTLAAREPVRVSPEVFRLLAHAQQLSTETGGTFDITLAPLLRCWGLLGRSEGRIPTEEELATARAVCGMARVELDPKHFTVRFECPGMMLDLGAIGKGYGVEQAVEILREAGVRSALLHGGTSTVAAIGTPPEYSAWSIAIEIPGRSAPVTIQLRDESLSVSAVTGKCFVADGRTRGHIIDPRTGQPAEGAQLAAVVLPSPTETDALSTALLVSGPAGYDTIRSLRPGMRTLVVGHDAGHGATVASSGIELGLAHTGQIIH
jgi:thiamine biosynthesis lipoprotein